MLRAILKCCARLLVNIRDQGKYDEAIATLQAIPTKND